ncbi:MAG: hypothetical protein O2809_09885 [Proteobacteria bacterium]|nr:hypothetical protein [Pseudomonadota bacterium]
MTKKYYPAESGTDVYTSANKIFEYDKLNNITKAYYEVNLEGNGFVSLTYNDLGGITQATHNISGANYTIGYGYDSDNKLNKITYPDGMVVDMDLDGLGNPLNIRLQGVALLSNIDYNAYGALNQFSFLDMVMPVKYTRNEMSFITRIEAPYAIDVNYTYNNKLNVSGMTDALDATNNVTYAYDVADRLLSSSYASDQNVYTYDGNNNISSVTGAAPYSAIFDASGRMSSDTNGAVSYDTLGNVKQYGGNTYKYNADNKLVNATVNGKNYIFEYDALDHLMLIKRADESNVIYVRDKEDHIMQMIDFNTNVVTNYVWLKGQVVAKITHPVGDIANYKAIGIVTDRLGSPLYEFTNAEILYKQHYYPYGKEKILNTETHIGFTGKDLPSDLGFVNMGYRYYSPVSYRFTGIDNILPSIDNVFSFNRYIYANDNPLKLKDETG